ncbi:hypothetical protein MMC12_000337 [Toensbergia leucococca]|nr:hypothetical protein [Toensbergia leucococca]
MDLERLGRLKVDEDQLEDVKVNHVDIYRNLKVTKSADLGASLKNLSLSETSRQPKGARLQQTAEPVADSWEEGASDDETESPSRFPSFSIPTAPPPTPISPVSSSRGTWSSYEDPYSPGRSSDGTISPIRSATSRPEKQTAVAERLIAGAIGVRPPKRTEEQRAYDRATKEKELKRREKEKEANRRDEEAAARAKADIWEG